MSRSLLAALFCFTALGAAHAGTGPGSLDPGFGSAGATHVDFGGGIEAAMALDIQPDGGYLMASPGRATGSPVGTILVARALRDGSPDPGFNGTGHRRLGTDSYRLDLGAIRALADGRSVVVGTKTVGSSPNAVQHGWITRLNADGSTDTGFGTGGVVEIAAPANPNLFVTAGQVLSDGRIVFAGYEVDHNSVRLPFAFRLLASGQPDPAFGSSGRATAPALGGDFVLDNITVDAQGKVLLAGFNYGVKPVTGALLRLNADGSVDQAFGAAGVLRRNIDYWSTEFTDVRVQPDGRILLDAYTYDQSNYDTPAVLHVLRLNVDGSPDAAFGNGGRFSYGNARSFAMLLQPDGRIVLAGAAWTNPQNGVILRLLPNGQPDPAFAAGGVYTNAAVAPQFVNGIALDPDGKIAFLSTGVAADNQQNGILGRLIGTEITTPVVEFYNGALNHYFITADPAEATAIDNGAAGPGWVRTGQTFRSGGPNRVCRFYGSPDTDPQTGLRRGPNGHFYTIDAAECAQVKQDAGWKFESYDFNGWTKTANGACPAGTTPVRRAYNNRYAQNDSNHRYAASDAIYKQMLMQGWTGEGIVFCAAS